MADRTTTSADRTEIIQQMHEFTVEDIERLSDDARPEHLADAIVFRVRLQDDDTGLAWVSKHGAVVIGAQVTEAWVAAKLNQLLVSAGTTAFTNT